MNKVNKSLLVIGFVWPEPTSSAAGKRMMQLLTFFKSQGWSITFASTAKQNKNTAGLSELTVACESIEVNDESFDRFVKKLNPEIVLFDRFMTEEQFGWRVHVQCPSAVRVLDTEDLHLLRYAREMSFKNNDDRIQTYLRSDVAKREIASIYRSDLSLIISETEIHLLHEFFKVPKELLLYLPFLFDAITDGESGAWPGFSERDGFMTIGNFRHKPNFDAVSYHRSDIWPLIRQSLPNATMHVFGSYPSQQVNEWHSPDTGFIIHGRAERVDTVMQEARVCLAPLRFGAGLKGKLIDAMLSGTPSITTSMGAEGINGSMDWPGVICDDPETFAQAAIKIYTDEARWTHAQKQGIRIINERFLKEVYQNQLSERLKILLSELEFHRTNNFTGSMLMHHTMASTRFMSRWIEEKNKPADDKNV
ncbi:glycosyltransferase [Rhodohalobacter sp. 8-1]|uniref:glycosyltransferase n=1 Tax=Rhodohalobacter sp. 8-1 TaxID=3131972 RepID=UPI0030EEF74D